MEPLDPDELYNTNKEKTFSNQDKLPPLPVPDLSHTLERYLDSGKYHDSYLCTQSVLTCC